MKRKMDNFSERKGISPLIAAVLLIAFTMTVAAILATWAQTFGRDRLDVAGREGRGAIDCPQLQASLSISDTDYSDDRADFLFYNSGGIQLSNFSFHVREDVEEGISEPIVFEADDLDPEDVTIEPGDYSTISIDIGEREGVDEGNLANIEVRALSQICPNEQPLHVCEFVYDNGETYMHC